MTNLRNNFNRRTLRVRNLAQEANYHLVTNNSGCPSANFHLNWLSSNQQHMIVTNPWDNRTLEG